MKNPKLFHIHAISPVHVGIGQSIGAVDLPIARERSSNLPIIPGSAIKGVLRDHFRSQSSEEIQNTLFGPENIEKNSDSFAGSLAFGDAVLLALPIRSLVGVVTFVSSPFLLSRYKESANLCGKDSLPEIPILEEDKALVVSTGLSDNNVILYKSKLILEDLDLCAETSEIAEKWSNVLVNVIGGEGNFSYLKTRFAIVHDTVLSFLADTATEVRTRIRINDKTGTAQNGALWYEENLPAESLLYGILGIDPPHKRDTNLDTQEEFEKEMKPKDGRGVLLQIGGKATVGRGLVRFLIDIA